MSESADAVQEEDAAVPAVVNHVNEEVERLRATLDARAKTGLNEEDALGLIDDYVKLLKALDSYDNEQCLYALKGIGRVYWDMREHRTAACVKLLQQGFVELSIKLLKHFNSIGLFKNDDVWFPTYYCLNNTWNYSDTSPDFAKELVEHGMLEMLLANLTHQPYLDNQKSKNVFYVLKSSLSILHNLARVPENKQKLTEMSVVQIVKPFTQSDTEFFQALAYLTLAYVVDESQNHELADSGSIKYIVKCMSKAINTPQKRRYLGFSPQELAEGLGNLAVNDENKNKIVEAGALPVFVNMMQYTDPDEQCSAARALWSLSFDDQVKQKIIEEPQCIEALERLAQSDEAHVRKVAKGALWELKNKAEQEHHTGDGRKNHVFISYNWGHQEIVLKIANKLKANNFRVWIDKDQMGGSTLEAMAKAVEDAAVVIVCMSEKYKLSPNCRTEAEYTFQLKKPILPLMMQRKYKPDGWLGMILGAKFFINFDGKYPFDEAFGMLLKELSERGRAEGPSLDVVDQEVVQAVSAVPTTGAPPPPPSISGWSADKVAEWLSHVDLENAKDKFAGCNGRMLLALHKVRFEAPQFFYENLKDMGLTMMEILKLVDAMDNIDAGT